MARVCIDTSETAAFDYTIVEIVSFAPMVRDSKFNKMTKTNHGRKKRYDITTVATRGNFHTTVITPKGLRSYLYSRKTVSIF